MIILDTDVISEAMRGHQADRRVLSWLRGLRDTPVTTVINRAELLAGLAVLPPGARRESLLARFQDALDSLADGLIAAIAMDHRAVLATRDTGGFAGLDLEVVDPWTAEP